MLLKLQEQYDRPYSILIRDLIREEFERTFGGTPLATFDGLGASTTKDGGQ